MSCSPLVTARGLGKLYRLYDTPQDRLKDSLLWRFGRTFGREFWALRDVSFELWPGQVLGIIGRNGSGKSTLLQMVAGVLQPTTGELSVHGRVAALLELGSGFNPEFTGRENVFLNGAILGLSRAETAARFEQIAEFADIGEFMDQPVKVYSSGMFVRLAFAVSTAVDADILVIDEALAVGDVFFRQKCYRRLERLREQGTAIVLVSHAMTEVEQFCQRGILLHHGRELFQGSATEAVKHYYLLEQHAPVSVPEAGSATSLDHFSESAAPEAPSATGVTEPTLEGGRLAPPSTSIDWPDASAFVDLTDVAQVTNGRAACRRLAICDARGQPSRVFEQGQRALFFYEFETLDTLEVPIGGLVLQNDKGVHVHGKNSLEYGSQVPRRVAKGALLRFRQEIALELGIGEYTLELGLAELPGSDFDRRGEYSHTQLDTRIRRLAHVPGAADFAVIFRRGGRPVQLLHHGVANLPGDCVVEVAARPAAFISSA